MLHYGPSILGRRVRTSPITTNLGPVYAQTMPIFAENFGHMLMAGEIATKELWQTDTMRQ